MLKQWIPAAKPDKEELDKRLDAAQEELLRLQMQIKEHKLPVLVLIEGWGAAGKGSTIGGIIKNIDPRFFKVASMSAPTEEEKRKPFLYRYFVKIPEAGKFEFLDSGWMDEVTKGRLRGELSDKQYAERIESIKRFERQLTDNGYLVLKLFFQIGKKEQKKRLEELEGNKDTAWRVGENDWWQNKHYDKCEEVFDKYLTDTNASVAPWYIIDSGDKKWAELQVLETLCSGIPSMMMAMNIFARAVRGGTGQGDLRGRIQERTASSAKEAECPALPPVSEKDSGSHRLRRLGCRRQGRQYQADRGSTGSQRLRGTPHRQPGTTRESETLSLAILDENS